MYIRQTRTNNKITGEGYFTCRLVRGERIGGRVRQITLLNPGRTFSVKQDDWPLLCGRIEQLLQPQTLLIPISCPDQLERIAQRIVGQLVSRSSVPEQEKNTSAQELSPTRPALGTDVQEVDMATLALSQPRSVGVEHLALHAVSQLGLIDKFTGLGANGVVRAAIMGNLVGRMAQPASELATWNWLQSTSALGELIDVDFTTMSHMALYRASDWLMRHQAAIEDHVFGAVRSLFCLEETITLYDLTNTYFEGEMNANPKAMHGRSKEKRSDCPLMTLGLVLDGSGFVRRSRTFAGNVAECTTLGGMLGELGAPHGALVIMDAGIASQANLDWLVQQGYRYLVVRRGGARQFDHTKAVSIGTASGETLHLQKEISEDGKEVRLYCYSEKREEKETAMTARFTARFEAGLQKLAEGLQKPRAEKGYEKIMGRIGRLKERSKGISQHYTITLVRDEKGTHVTALTWEKSLTPGSMATHPGVYCLRSNEINWDEERLWRTYSMLTDLESVFRSLKTELGLRPVFHTKEVRCDGHLFITVLAYQCVQVLRHQLKAAGIHDSWTSLRQTASVQRRVTTSLRCTDGRTVHIRKSTSAEPALHKIYQTMGVQTLPGGIKKLVS